MDILHLTYFIEVARQKSFTRASQILHVSQPSISKVIKTLENELGVTLFERMGREISLTDVGQAVYNRAQAVVSEFQDLSREIHDVVHIQKGKLIVGLPPMIGSSFFPKIIGKFKSKYPQIDLKLIEVGSRQIEIDVKNGMLDIGVVALPLIEKEIDHICIVNEKLRAVFPKDHCLALCHAVKFSDLQYENFILYSDDFSLNDLIYEQCRLHKFTPKVVCQSSHWDFIVEMVAERLGIALLPETICRELSDRCISLPINDAIIPWNLALIWKKNKYLSFAAHEWLNLSEAHFQTI